MLWRCGYSAYLRVSGTGLSPDVPLFLWTEANKVAVVGVRMEITMAHARDVRLRSDYVEILASNL